jgi:hypothetical protein
VKLVNSERAQELQEAQQLLGVLTSCVVFGRFVEGRRCPCGTSVLRSRSSEVGYQTTGTSLLVGF